MLPDCYCGTAVKPLCLSLIAAGRNLLEGSWQGRGTDAVRRLRSTYKAEDESLVEKKWCLTVIVD